jgi:DTW domain-containing protein YfiP
MCGRLTWIESSELQLKSCYLTNLPFLKISQEEIAQNRKLRLKLFELYFEIYV